MGEIDNIKSLLEKCTDEQRKEIFLFLRKTHAIHVFETTINTKAEVILEALARAPDLTIRGVRGIIGEATFALEVAPKLAGWKDVTPVGNHSYDCALSDQNGTVRVQVKMQRRKEMKPWIRDGAGVVEVQRTRSGIKDGASTRPYRFGEFDMLACCMEPSHEKWNSFLYCPCRWLLPRPEDPLLVLIHQPVPLSANQIWTADFNEAVERLRNKHKRPAD